MTEEFKRPASGLDKPGTGLPLSQKPGWDWRVIVLELVIVFVGLFAALQLDSYRDQREFEAAQHRYLLRLRADLQSYVEQLEPRLEFLRQNVRANEQVYRSLDAGEIINGDTALFDRGLIYYGHLPSSPLPRATYDEMLASGMFSTLHSEELKSRVSELFWTHEWTEQNFSWWRDDLPMLNRALYPLVRFHVGGPIEDPAFLSTEMERSVTYDFDALASNPAIVNGFYWMTDIASDWFELTGELFSLANQALAAIDQELEGGG